MSKGSLLVSGSIVIACLILGLTLGRPSPGQAPAPAAAKWEYRVVRAEGTDRDLQTALNKMGEDGWEVIGDLNRATGPAGDFQTCILYKRLRR